MVGERTATVRGRVSAREAREVGWGNDEGALRQAEPPQFLAGSDVFRHEHPRQEGHEVERDVVHGLSRAKLGGDVGLGDYECFLDAELLD